MIKPIIFQYWANTQDKILWPPFANGFKIQNSNFYELFIRSQYCISEMTEIALTNKNKVIALKSPPLSLNLATKRLAALQTFD